MTPEGLFRGGGSNLTENSEAHAKEIYVHPYTLNTLLNASEI